MNEELEKYKEEIKELINQLKIIQQDVLKVKFLKLKHEAEIERLEMRKNLISNWKSGGIIG